MKKKIRNRLNKEIKGPGTAMMIFVLAVIIIIAIDWLLSCWLIWIVCSLFKLKFNIRIATGVWIILCIAQRIFATRK